MVSKSTPRGQNLASMSIFHITDPGHSSRFTTELILIFAGCCVAYFFSFVWEGATLFNGLYLPVSHDSFYHAARVLDAIEHDRSIVFQFDPMMHAPEGGWVNWPWAYDSLLVLFVRVGQIIWSDWSVSKLLAHTPLIWVTINTTLIVLLTRLIGLSLPLRIAVLIAFVFNPLTQWAHGFGVIDHHQAEQALMLGATCAWIAWLRQPERGLIGFFAGFVPGIASAFHASLFLLFGAIGLSVFILWCRNLVPSVESTKFVLLGALAGITIAILPAETVWEGQVTHYLLSWFHFFVVASFSLFIFLASKISFSWRVLLILLPLIAAMGFFSAPILIEGTSYIAGTGELISQVSESKSGLYEWLSGNISSWFIATQFTGWVWLAPASLAVTLLALPIVKDKTLIGFLSFSFLGLVLLHGQYRFAVFGTAFMVITPLICYSIALRSMNPRLAWTAPLLAMAMVLPSIGVLLSEPPLSLDGNYALLHSAYRSAEEICSSEPGIILAHPMDGHHLRYETDCAVVANMFLVDELSQFKVFQSFELLSEVAEGESLATVAPWLEYILVRWFIQDHTSPKDSQYRRDRFVLLKAKQSDLPHLELIWESQINMQIDGETLPAARIFRVIR